MRKESMDRCLERCWVESRRKNPTTTNLSIDVYAFKIITIIIYIYWICAPDLAPGQRLGPWLSCMHDVRKWQLICSSMTLAYMLHACVVSNPNWLCIRCRSTIEKGACAALPRYMEMLSCHGMEPPVHCMATDLNWPVFCDSTARLARKCWCYFPCITCMQNKYTTFTFTT